MLVETYTTLNRSSYDRLIPLEIFENLYGSGFDPWMEAAKMFLEYHKAIGGGDSSKEAILRPLKSFKGNILGVQGEYMLRRSLLPNPMRKRRIKEKERLLPYFSDDPLVDITSERERMGSVKRNISNLEKFVLGGANRIAFYISPTGESGFFDTKGKPIIYKETQIFMVRSNEKGDLDGLTLVTDSNREDNIKLQKVLGFNHKEGFSDYETVSNMTGNLVFREKGEGLNNFEDVIKLVQKTKSSPWARKLKTINGKVIYHQFDQILQDLARKDELLKMNDACLEIVEEFNSFILNNPDILNAKIPGLLVSFEDLIKMNPDKAMDTLKPLLYDSNEARLLVKKIARVVLGIQNQCELNQEPMIDYRPRVRMNDADYVRAYKTLRLVGGCNGGGETGTDGVIMTSTGPRLTTTSSECPKISCKKCSWEASNHEVYMIQKGHLKECPKCGWKP